jgi:hypothetical protein
MTTPTEPRPIPVHLASVAPELGELGRYAPAAAASSPTSAPRSRRAVYRTVTLTAAEPVQEIMAASDDRIIAYVVVVDADVFLSDNKSDAAAGRGAYVPCVTPTATKPNLAAPYPLEDNRVIYAGPVAAITGTNVIRISVNGATQ